MTIRMRCVRSWASILTLGSVLVACRTAHDAPPEAPALTAAGCWFDAAGANPPQCAWLRPSRQDSTQSTMLPVVVIPAAPQLTSEYAIVYLNGGPGGDSGLDEAGLRDWRYWHAALNLELDLVVYDQRGAGRSRPELPCVGYAQALRRELESTADRPTRMAELDAAVLPCLLAVPEQDRHEAVYSTATAAQDLRELMAALQQRHGYRGFILYGASYGTRLAIEALREPGVPVTRVVLDSVYPPGAGTAMQAPGQLDALLEAFDAECRLLPGCRLDESGIRAPLLAALARFADAPLTVQINDPAAPATKMDVHINDENLFGTVLYALYFNDQLSRLPDLLEEAADGRLEDDWRELIDLALGIYLNAGINPVANTLVSCRDNEQPQRETMAVEFERFPDFRQLLEPTESEYSLCRRLGVTSQPLSTDWRIDIPTLVVNMALDPATPADDARAIMSKLGDGELIIVPGAGHGAALSDTETAARVGAFLNGREYEPPADSCPAPGTFDT